MLQQMRSGAQSVLIKLVLFGLLLLAMLGLAFTDVQGMFRSGVSASSGIAKINGQKITTSEFDRIFQSTLRQQNIGNDDAMRNALPMMVLNQEINTRIYNLASHDMGLLIDDKTVANKLKSDVLGPIAAETGLSEKEALQRLLTNLGISERAFVETFKNQLASETLTSLLPAPARAPEQMINDALKRRYEWRRGEYFELTAADVAKELKPASEDELKKYYESIANDFLLPEYRSFDVLLLDRDALGLNGKPDAAAVESYYNEHSDEFALPEQRKIEQLIVADEALAKTFMDEAKGGQTLGAIAKAAKASGDATKLKTVFTTSTYSEDEMDVELADTAFKASANALTGPVKTPFGWHIMKIVSVTPARTPPLAEVRARIEKDLGDEINSDALYKRATEIDDQIAAGASLADVAKQNKLKVISFSDVTSEGTDKNGKKIETKLPAFAKILETAYTLDQDRTSPLTETSDGALLLISTTSITPAKEQPFDAVRAEVAESLRLKKLGELFDAKSAEITEKMQLGESFETVAKRLGKRVNSTGLVQRGSTPAKAGIARGVLPALFSLDKVGQTTAVSGEEKVIILRLAERKIEKPKDVKKEDVATLHATLDRAIKNDILEQYRAYLLAKYKVSINEELLNRMYARKDDSDDDM